ncbi:MAG: cytochrome c biogenesis protein CcsA [Bdellovibrionales bacterium]|nr:cytochrome c biogenesis protein CcsA [Bdellovibrionales bacterium]
MFHALAIAAVVFYFAASWSLVSSIRRGEGALQLQPRGYLVAGLAAHLAFLVLFVGQEIIVTGQWSRPTTITAVSAFVVGIFLFVSGRGREIGLAALVVPVGMTLLVISAFVFHSQRQVEPLPGMTALISLHLAAGVVGTGLLLLNAICAMALLIKERAIRTHSLTVFARALPSLVRLEQVSGQAQDIGFTAMVLAVLFGIGAAVQTGVQNFALDPRSLWSLVVLSFYGVLLYKRKRSALRGRKAALMALAAFCVIILSYLLMTSSFHVY